MRRSKADKAITHSKILSVAAKRFRERGPAGIGVADVMKEAGSSVGGFYEHFGSRDDLVDAHRDKPATGCAVTTFAGDVRHASSGVRTVYTQRVKHTLGY